MENKNLSIGFIGIGVMGKSMVNHLMQNGHKVYVYNRTKAKSRFFSARGCDLVIHRKS